MGNHPVVIDERRTDLVRTTARDGSRGREQDVTEQGRCRDQRCAGDLRVRPVRGVPVVGHEPGGPGHQRCRRVFVRDRVAQLTRRVSVGAGGQQANASSSIPAISAYGRFVAFPSYASNLVPGDTNGAQDVFVRDRKAH
jgi:hypothetical protein